MTQQEELIKTLEKLHSQLKSYQPETALDEKSTQLLGQIAQDIQHMNQARPEGDKLYPEGLEEAIIHFEQDHPTLTGILRDVADLLNKSGI
ncbi:MAG: DUF4404 family protein [Pseudomonadales bacterium]|nr:DUF4404 family protein [Pseudomonadales bacterium]